MDTLKLSASQMFWMTFSFTIGTTLILLPSGLIASAHQYAWVVYLWSCAFGLAAGLFWLYIAKLHPGLSLVEISRKVLGKYAGGAVSICYIVFFIQIASWVTRNICDYMQINLMPNTPLIVFNLMALLICAYAVIQGADSISYVSVFMAPLLTISFWVPFTVMIKEWEWQFFQYPAVFQIWPTMVQTNYSLGFPFMENVAFMMVFPMVQSRLRASYLGGILMAGILMAMATFFTIGILGVYRSAHLTYPLHTIFREMQFSGVIEHLEAFLSVAALLFVFFKLSIIFYFSVLAICQLFRIRSRAAVAYPLVWIISAYAMLFSSVMQNAAWVQKYLFVYYLPFGIGFPLLLLAATWLSKLKTNKEEHA
ncbi:endospore germination permease [Paenibacillus sp. R14(2021)]|uniref:GerAB/ArcD/ProY family transporter n=1 Tax=Paenibacillus sp. R14(2021) TaxID=2859228 RepID=UPI001C6148BD|nr:endospore germination permease [Paenibacillus sp. R14(2021)]